MEISPDDLTAMLAQAAQAAVDATYKAIAERERVTAADREAQEARQAAEAEEDARRGADTLEAAQKAEGVAWAGDLFGNLARAIAAAAELDRVAHETRNVKVAMFDAAGAFMGVAEGRADLMGATVDGEHPLPDWAKPPPITYVEWKPEHDDLMAAALAEQAAKSSAAPPAWPGREAFG